MSIVFRSQTQDESLARQNIANKGFATPSPTQGCTYVVQPPQGYQKVFQNLQKRIVESNLPIALVRIPHMTVITAKISDLKPGQLWREVAKVQKIYRGFFLYQIYEKMKERLDYKTAVKEALLSHEGTMAKIAGAFSESDALTAIDDPIAYAKISASKDNDPDYEKIKEAALSSINETSFDLKILSVELTNNGSIIFKLNEDEKILEMRMDLIVAGQGISKWQKLSVMKHGWSTIGYTTKVIGDAEKAKTETVLRAWIEENRSDLELVTVCCNVDSLGCLAVRSNDFHAVKRVVFPMAKKTRPRPDPILIPEREISLQDLQMTPRAGEDGPSPIAGNRRIHHYGKESWEGPIDREVLGDVSL